MSGQSARSHWVFGYGSLIYKVDFPWLEKEVATVVDWSRRFWQGSHDHRGTPDAPGRVVTLIESPDAICLGVAYRIEASVFEHLDHREKNGYQRFDIPITLRASTAKSTPRRVVGGTVYVAGPANEAFLGPAPAAEIARHIVASRGPSGSNLDYFRRLECALHKLQASDPHIAEISRELAALTHSSQSLGTA